MTGRQKTAADLKLLSKHGHRRLRSSRARWLILFRAIWNSETLERAKADIAAAAKSAQAEARGKSKNLIAKKDTTDTSAAKPPSVEAPVEHKPSPAKTPSLFEMAQESEPGPVAANFVPGV